MTKFEHWNLLRISRLVIRISFHIRHSPIDSFRFHPAFFGSRRRLRPLSAELSAEVLATLQAETGLSTDSRIADLGSGTGISAELFLSHGNVVYAVEPNREMRAAAEAALAKYPQFHSVVGAAEATSLPDHSVDYVVAAQAFHWFDAEATRRESQRILRPQGWVVLVWNTRRVDTTPFLRAYEMLLQKFATDYQQVDHRNIDQARLQAFYGSGRFKRRVLENEQVFDLAGLRGRLCSSSYTPPPGDPRYGPMIVALERIFHEHQENGRVRFEYDTELYFGHVG